VDAADRSRARTGLWVLLVVLLIVAYPWLLSRALERFGVPAVAWVALGLGVVGMAMSGRRFRRSAHPGLLTSFQLVGLGLLSSAALSGERQALLLVPVLVQVVLSFVFWQSLRGPVSIVEKAARLMQPRIPDWVSSYCRIITILWCIFFGLNALLIGWLALSGSADAWMRYTGGGLYLVAGVLQLIEFVFRKLWFRNYSRGPLDPLFQRLFPAADTARGRRSLEHIQRKRREMAGE